MEDQYDETAYASYGGYEMEEEEYFEEEEYEEEEEQPLHSLPLALSPRSQNQRAAYASSLAKQLYGSGGTLPTSAPASSDPPASAAHDDVLKAALLMKRQEYESQYNTTYSNEGSMMMANKNASKGARKGGAGGSARAGASASAAGRRDSLEAASASPMFNYDDEQANPEPADTAPEDELTWRLDPIKSLSDWTISVTNRETSECQTYHVHRNVLAVGKCRAEYFVRYFQSHDRLASSKTGTEIWLEKVAAKTMPQLLDYMYSTEGKLDISTESAIGLRHLAQFFGLRPLHKKVMDFILQDMSMTNIDVYYRDSVSVDDDKVAEMAAAKCAENILEIKITKPGAGSLLNNVDAHFFRRIMSSPAIDSKPKHYHVSALLAEFVLANKQHLDEQDFERLTDERYLKHIHHQAALTLLEVEADLGLSVADEDKPNLTTALQNRCIQDLTAHWDDVSKMKQEYVLRILRKLPSTVVAELFVKSLAQARKTVNESNENTSTNKPGNKKSVTIVAPGGQGGQPPRKSARQQGNGPKSNGKDASAAVREEYEAKIVAMSQGHERAMLRLKKEFEVSLLKLRDMVLEKDQDLTKYAKELKKFQRLPNAHGGKLVSSNDKNKPVGMPNALPGSRPQSPEGVIYAKMNGGGRFPLFYYNPSSGDERKSSKSSSSAPAGTAKQRPEV